jgi:opacity protein-like surface antigen
MNKLAIIVVSCAVVGLRAGAVNAAGPEQGQWRWSINAGTSSPTDAVAQQGAASTIADFGLSTGPLAGSGGTIALRHVRYSDIFGTGWNLGTEISYGESATLEAFARLSYESLPGRSAIVVGRLTSPALAAAVPIYAQFGDPKSWQLALGQRYYFLPGSSLRPFVGVDLGFDHSNSVSASFGAPDAGISFGTGRYFKASTGLLADAGVGLAYGVTPALSVNFSIDAEYRSRPSVDGVALSAAGIPAMTASDSHWTYPARLGVSYSF